MTWQANRRNLRYTLTERGILDIATRCIADGEIFPTEFEIAHEIGVSIDAVSRCMVRLRRLRLIVLRGVRVWEVRV